MISNASEFLALSALKRSKVTVMGQEIHFRELSVAEREKMIKVAATSAAEGETYLLSTCVLSPEGTQLFKEDQAAELAKVSPAVVDEVAAAIMVLSGLKDPNPKND